MISRIVITGMGCMTPIGHCVDAFWESCLLGRHGISEIKHFDKAMVKSSVAAQITDIDPVKILGRKVGRRLDRCSQLAVLAAREAVKAAELIDMESEHKAYQASRIGICLGTGVGGVGTFEAEAENRLKSGSTYVNPLLMPKWIPNMAAANVSLDLGVQGPVHTITTACASGIDAVGHGLMLLESGRVDAVLVGGAESCITPTMVSGFENMGALSQSDCPDTASTPFDVNRKGFVLGEGAAVLVLERLENALERHAPIYAEISGYGSTADAYHITAPEPNASGGVEAIKQALGDAGIDPKDIGYINAHGTSTPQNDLIEALCLNQVFKDSVMKIPVNSTKSLVGHMQGAAGALETIVCALTLKFGQIHPTAGTQTIDPQIHLNVPLESLANRDVKYALNNALGFGGHNGALILKKWEFDKTI